MIQQTMALDDATLLNVIHFLISSGEDMRLACAPHLRDLSSVRGRPFAYQRTNEPRAVTCPLCKKGADYKAAILPYGETK